MADRVASAFDLLAAETPSSIAIVDDGPPLSWEAFAERARRLAWYLSTEVRLEVGDRVAIALGSDRELLEVVYAALMLGCDPVVLSYLLDTDATHATVDRCDAKVLVHRPERRKTARVAAKRIAKPWRPLLLEAGDEYEHMLDRAPPPRDWTAPQASSGGVFLIAVGQHDPGALLVWSEAEVLTTLRASFDTNLRRARVLPLAPLAHALGLFAALRTLVVCGTVVLTDVEPLEPSAVWDVAAREDVEVITNGSDATLSALARALSRAPERWQLSRLRTIVSSTPINAETRRLLATVLPDVEVRQPPEMPARVGDRIRVIEPATGRDVVPGSGAVGAVVIGGTLPLGYYGDPQRTASTFCSIGGVRYRLTGARATVDDTGTIRPVGDSQTKRTEDQGLPALEVEAKLRKHPSVVECVVVDVHGHGVAGRTAVALVQVLDGHFLDEPELAAWCRSRLRAFEPPARFLFVDDLSREDCDPSDRGPARQRAAALLEGQSNQ